MRFICLETCKFNHAGWSLKDAIRAHCIVSKLLCDAHSFVRLSLGNKAALDFNLILTVGWRLTSKTLFKLITAFLVINSKSVSVRRWFISMLDWKPLHTALKVVLVSSRVVFSNIFKTIRPLCRSLALCKHSCRHFLRNFFQTTVT